MRYESTPNGEMADAELEAVVAGKGIVPYLPPITIGPFPKPARTVFAPAAVFAAPAIAASSGGGGGCPGGVCTVR